MKVTKPGAYDGIPSADYHRGDICPGPSLSASGLKRLVLDCPAMFWADSALNPKREEKRTKALDFGRAAHALQLGEPEFAAEFVVSPYDDYRTKEAREWRDAQSRVVVSAAQFETIEAMVAALRATPMVAGAFKDGVPERSFFTKDPETGIWLKVRPDWTPNNLAASLIQEFKTAADIRPRKLAAAVFEYGYEIQAALQLDVVEAVTGEKPLGIAHVVQEKDPPYLATLHYFTPDQLSFGRTRYRAALRIFAECWDRHRAGHPERVAWPGYTTEPIPFETPFYIQKEIEAQAKETMYEPGTSRAA